MAEQKAPVLYRVDVVDRGSKTVSGDTRRNVPQAVAEAIAEKWRVELDPLAGQEVIVRQES